MPIKNKFNNISGLNKYNNLFCDSKEALEWLYKNGLSRCALVRTSSPTLLFDIDKYNVEHVEKRWTVDELKTYQTSMNEFIKSIYQAAITVDGITHEIALAISLSVLNFHKTIYKASCLTESDLFEPRIIVQVHNNTNNGWNNINSPWASLLLKNKKAKIVNYELKHDESDALSAQNLSWLKRYRIAGIETILFRAVTALFKYIPDCFTNRKVIVPSENELVIETAASLILKGVVPINIDSLAVDKSLNESFSIAPVWSKIQPIVNNRLQKFVINELIERCENMLFTEVSEALNRIESWKFKLDPYFKSKNDTNKIVVLSNTLVKEKGIAIAECCRKYKIPVISAQHGVTYEICATHDEMSVVHEINLADRLLVYNGEAKFYAESSGFNYGKAYIVGMSSRHRRVQVEKSINHNFLSPIVFVSTNLYKGNLGLLSTWETDFDRAKKECKLIDFVFSKLPHTVHYKPYPEENRRYSDPDPVLKLVKSYNNIKLYDTKIDMRYLLKQHRVFVTTCATSTLSWLIMSGNPVVFINAKNNMPLMLDAHKYFSKGLFLFDDDDDGFYENIKKFLSQPIEIIEKQWEKKEKDRALMIKRFFSSFPSGAGHRAADMIYSDYLK